MIAVSHEQLAAVAALVPPREPPRSGNHRQQGQPIDVRSYAAEHGLSVISEKPWNGGALFVLDQCPWDKLHTNRCAYLIQHSSGAVSAHCHHNSCSKNGWHELRDRCEPGWRKSSRRRAPIPREEGAEGNGTYFSTNDGVFWNKPLKEACVPTALTNFDARIKAQVIHDDGAEQRRYFEIEASIGDHPPRPITIPVAQFTLMNWPVEHLGSNAIVWPGQGTKDHARAAIQWLSGEVPTRTVYRHTGWRAIDGVWVYLHAGGAIGPVGPVSGVEVDLPGALSCFRLPSPPSDKVLVDAIQASLRVLDLDPDDGMVPFWAAGWRAALSSCDFALHATGTTGEGKSERAALIQQHFGKELNARNLPANWSSTGNALEGLAHAAKDALLVVDDFAPSGAPGDVQRYHKDAERLFRAQGNSQGRGRMTSTAELRPCKPPRGLILSTGEDTPRAHSIRARLLVLLIEAASPGFWQRLSACQRDAADGLYEQAMAAFVAWLATGYDEEAARRQTRLITLRDLANRDGNHRRTPIIVAELAYAVERFVAFAVEKQALSAKEGEALVTRCWVPLGRAAEAQTESQQQVNPARRFVELLRASITAGRAHLASRDGTLPYAPGACGWRLRKFGDHEEWQPCGDRIGWCDEQSTYLEPDVSYKVATTMDPLAITVTQASLHKQLKQQGLLVQTDGNRSRIQVRQRLQGMRQYVLHVRHDSLLPQDAAQPAHPAHAVKTNDNIGPHTGPVLDDSSDERPPNRPLEFEGVDAEGTSGPVMGGERLGEAPHTDARCTHADPSDWINERLSDGRTRTSCHLCGRLVGYLPHSA